MFSKNIEPSQPSETPRPTKKESPERKATPSQEGKFLEALERKEEKKTKKGTTDKTPEELKKEKESLFHLAQTKHSQEKEGGEEEGTFSGEGQEEKEFGKGIVPTEEQSPSAKGVVATKAPGEKVSLISGESKERVAFAHPEDADKMPTISQEGIKEKIFPVGKEKKVSTKVEDPKVIMPPPLQPNEVSTTAVPAEVQSTERSQLVDIVKQTVAAVAEMVNKHETTMVVTLKHPPIFDGASLIIKESVTAQKEFNITFANLSPDARRLVESVANQEQLRQGLVEKGYVLHMVAIDPNLKNVAATETENRSSGEHSSDQEERGDATDSQSDQKQQR